MGSKTRAAGRRFREGDFSLPSPDGIEAAKTPAGAWSAMQLAEWGVKWPPKAGWRRNLEARWNDLHGVVPEQMHAAPEMISHAAFADSSSPPWEG